MPLQVSESDESEDGFEVEDILQFRKTKVLEEIVLIIQVDYTGTRAIFDQMERAQEIMDRFWKLEAERNKVASTKEKRKSKSSTESRSKKPKPDPTTTTPTKNAVTETIPELEKYVNGNECQNNQFSDEIYLDESHLPKHILTEQSWDKFVAEVATIESGIQNDFIVYVNWKDGLKTHHSSLVANKKLPQKLIKFYEKHLRFSE
ncbi:hypothetical protein HDV02_000565 [Globomyces sp. JEL0801]|nr:hypothetical protein HDV02_000565 [Globomyces sp. JEL0801]